MKKQNDDTTPRQQRAIASLLAGAGVAEAAEAAGVCRSTLCRWQHDPAFAEALRDARRQAFAAALDQLATIAGRAVRTLDELLTTDQPAHVRCSAALGVLKLTRESLELDDLAERLAALERAVMEREK